MNIRFYENGEVNEKELKFVVLQARYQDQWIFVRHKERSTWEIPGGHIEFGESPDEAAKRELIEETGSIDFQCRMICDYSLERNGKASYGRLYYCEVHDLGEVGEYEIAEVKLMNELPAQLTYAKIQPSLYKKVSEELKISEQLY